MAEDMRNVADESDERRIRRHRRPRRGRRGDEESVLDVTARRDPRRRRDARRQQRRARARVGRGVRRSGDHGATTTASAARSAWAATSSCRPSPASRRTRRWAADRGAPRRDLQERVPARGPPVPGARELVERFIARWVHAGGGQLRGRRRAAAAARAGRRRRPDPAPHVVRRCGALEAGSGHRAGGAREAAVEQADTRSCSATRRTTSRRRWPRRHRDRRHWNAADGRARSSQVPLAVYRDATRSARPLRAVAVFRA